MGEADLIALRPGRGIPANRIHEIVGLRVRGDVRAGDAIQYEQIEARPERRTA